ncbi:MAG: hypothetical protein BWY26_00410 [Elusimicrobia bacterium ADurb.Bin231]|nr:MAG: hypothetical protein BWY26_00410 [Elusimicrobia bacterium ADurb.Bin231]
MDFIDLSVLLTETLWEQPSEGGIRNAVQHMWGYVSDISSDKQTGTSDWSLRRLLLETQKRAVENNVKYLMESTALSELMLWLPKV